MAGVNRHHIPGQVLLMGRKVRGGSSEHYKLQEREAAYNARFAPEKVLLNTENTYFFGLNVEQSTG